MQFRKLLAFTSILLFLALGFNPPIAFALSSWSINSTPVLTPGNPGSWDSAFVTNPYVLHENNLYKMWYVGSNGGHAKLGYATSTNGANWTKYATNPIIDLSVSGNDLDTLSVMHMNGEYKIWYVDDGTQTMNYSTSLDGISWNAPTTVFIRTQPWESSAISHPDVIYVNGEYRMYYSGNSNGIISNGLAVSSDGVNWIKYINNPILSPSNQELPVVGAPSVILDNSQYTMFYHSNQAPTKISSATSQDGTNWSENPENPLFTNSDIPNVQQIFAPSVVLTNGNLQMWFARYDGFQTNIGYAFNAMLTNKLPVPLLKQTDNPWQSQIYDNAQLWAPSSPTMYSWGCAVTSAAMVFQYHGITKMPDNSPLDPGSVNSWLNSQPDGFVGNGNVNWLALTRLSSLAKQSGNNPGFTFDALQFQKILGGANSQNVATLTDDVKVNPDILEEPGHFVVATGTQAATFTINDPYFPRETLNDGYSNSFLTLNRFIPSHTDLSYIMLDSSQNVTFTLKDATGSAVGQQFTQQPLQDDAHPGTLAGQNENIFYFSQPTDGTYQLTITGANRQLYSLKGFLYDVHGAVKPFTLNGVIDASHPDTFTITFSKTNQQTDSLDKFVSFDSVLRDIQNLYNTGDLKRDAYRNLLEETKEAQRKYQKSHFKFIKKLELGEQLLYLKWHQGRSVSQAAYDILFYDFMQLIKTL